MDAPPADQLNAERLAKRVSSRSGGKRGGWLEVRTLMNEFGVDRLSDEARTRMTNALESAGLTVDPPLDEVDRSGTVVLKRQSTDPAVHAASAATPDSLDRVLSVRAAGPKGRLARVTLEDLKPSLEGGVRWFDLRDSARVDAQEILERLNPGCNYGLTAEMVADLLSPDPRPKIGRYPGGTIRHVAAFRVLACESDDGVQPGSHSKAGVLVFEPMEFLVGPDWLITCWHDAEVYRGAERIYERPSSPPDDLYAEVERCWPATDLSSAGDLGVLILHEVALTYAKAYRQLYVWQEEWELDFYRRPDRIDRETLLEARASAAILRDWLSPLNPSGMRQDIDRAWFSGITGTINSGGYERALRVDDRIDEALKGLRDFSETLRSAYDLLQLREGERERDRDDRFQRNIAVGGAAILIPTLVAGIMGANTWVPGQFGPSSPHWAFMALLLLVLLSGVSAWIVLRWLRDRDADARN